MDILQYIPNLLGGGLVAMLLVQLGKKLLKSVNDRYGALATQALLLVASILVAVAGWFINLLPAEFVQTTVTIFASGMIVYEVLWKALFKEAVMGE